MGKDETNRLSETKQQLLRTITMQVDEITDCWVANWGTPRYYMKDGLLYADFSDANCRAFEDRDGNTIALHTPTASLILNPKGFREDGLLLHVGLDLYRCLDFSLDRGSARCMYSISAPGCETSVHYMLASDHKLYLGEIRTTDQLAFCAAYNAPASISPYDLVTETFHPSFLSSPIVGESVLGI